MSDGESVFGTRVSDSIAQKVDDLGRAIRQQPFTSVLLGVAFGYVVASVIHRPR